MHKLWQIDDLEIGNRPPDGHKGTFGRVLIIGGSVDMSGAPVLAGTAALRGGSGLVTVAVPKTIQSVVAGCEICFTTQGLICDVDGELVPQFRDEICELLAGRDAVAIGPGLGQSEAAEDLVRTVLQEATCPVVLDADALNVAARAELLQNIERTQACVITPHPGEFARLTGLDPATISNRRQELAEEFARTHQVTVVLKGSETIVTDGTATYINGSGNSGMATGGTGDVLTGLVASQLGQSSDLFPAVAISVYIHGLAGDLAAETVSERGMIASDLLRFLGPAWLKFEENRSNR